MQTDKQDITNIIKKEIPRQKGQEQAFSAAYLYFR